VGIERQPGEEAMTEAAKPIPKGYRSITPYLICGGAAGAIDFYKRAFGARERMRIESDGRIGHAEVSIGGSVVMLADEFPDYQALSPKTVGGTPVSIHLYVKDVDKTFAKAVSAGAEIRRPVADQFYGDRSGTLVDPYGHVWHVATHKQDLTPEEIAARAPKPA
jgi:PhnB protein